MKNITIKKKAKTADAEFEQKAWWHFRLLSLFLNTLELMLCVSMILESCKMETVCKLMVMGLKGWF